MKHNFLHNHVYAYIDKSTGEVLSNGWFTTAEQALQVLLAGYEIDNVNKIQNIKSKGFQLVAVNLDLNLVEEN